MENNQNQSDETLEDAASKFVDDGIFTDKSEAIEGMRKAAEELGINPDLVAPTEDKVHYVAKKNCTYCYGQGAVNVVLSPQKEKTFFDREGLPGRTTTRKRSAKYKMPRGKYKAPVRVKNGPTSPSRKKIIRTCEANESTNEQWDTRRPEPDDYKQLNSTLAFCRCVRAFSA